MIAQALAQTNAPFINNLRKTVDADDHAACLRDWGQYYDQLSAGAFEGTFEEFSFGNVQIFREHLNQSVHENGLPWAGSRTVAVASAIEGDGWFSGGIFDYDSIVTLKGGEELDFRTPRQHELLAATVNATELNNYSLLVEHRDLDAELTGHKLIAAHPACAERLRSFLATVLASLRATPQMLVHEQIRKALEQAVYATILESISANPEPHRTHSSRARKIVVERARDFIHQHVEEPISIADLCIHLRVSQRTLQYSFQDVLDISPVKFLRAVRLNGVRRTLKRADPDDTVGDIAARWGIWHLSHFAADYRAMFDELPSDTLRRPSCLPEPGATRE